MAHILVHDESYAEDRDHKYIVVKVINKEKDVEVGQVKIYVLPDDKETGDSVVGVHFEGKVKNIVMDNPEHLSSLEEC